MGDLSLSLPIKYLLKGIAFFLLTLLSSLDRPLQRFLAESCSLVYVRLTIYLVVFFAS